MIKFGYLPHWQWWVGAGMAAGLVLLLSYCVVVGRPRWWLRVCLIGLRWAAIVAVGLCLLDPHRLEEVRRNQTSSVAVLLDASRSMGIPDVPETRLKAAQSWLRRDLLPAWPPEMPRSFFVFHQSLEPVPDLDKASPTGSVTALAGALEQLLAVPREEPLAGVILCSDGIDNAAGDPAAVAKQYRRKGIPIHTATFGTTQEPKDIVLENVQVKRAVPNLAPTRIGLTIRSPGFAGRTVPVQIRLENQVVASQQVRLTGGEQRFEMEFTPRRKGFQSYQVLIPAQAGEWLTSNNRRVFGLEVTDPTLRVIYMEGTPQQTQAPIPEWKYLKDALQSDPNIKVTVLYQTFSSFGNTEQPGRIVDVDPETGEKIYPVNHPTRGFPRTMAELLKYDVIIHSDIKVQFFTAEQLMNMARFVEQEGGGFVMVGGTSAFGKGGYQKTIIDRIIPVAMQQYADTMKMSFRMEVLPAALDHPVMAIGATRGDTLRIWTEKLPMLHGFNRVDRAKPGAVVLAVTPSAGLAGSAYAQAYGQRVVLAVQEIGHGRSMAFTSDTTRTWGSDFETLWGERINPSLYLSEANCDSRYYRAFWINAVRWLAAGKAGKTNNAVTLELAQGYCAPNQPVRAAVKVRSQDAQEISGAQVSLVVSSTGANRVTNNAVFDAGSLSYVTDLRAPAAGTHTVTAVATVKGSKLGEDQQLLTCEATDQEMAEVRAQPELMASLARLSGGKDLTPRADNAVALSSIFKEASPGAVSYRRTPLWDNGWWLAMIAGLLTAEWVLRRMKGLA